MTNEQRQEIKAIATEAFREFLAASQVDPIIIDPVTITEAKPGDYFNDIGDFVNFIIDGIEDTDGVITVSSAYHLLAEAIDYGIDFGFLDQAEEWKKISDLFLQRGNENITDSTYVVVRDNIPSGHELLRIAEILINKWGLDTDRDLGGDIDDFTIDKKVLFIRSSLIVLRNMKFISPCPLLGRMFTLLANDWRVMGGGFGNNMGTGSKPWSYGG